MRATLRASDSHTVHTLDGLVIFWVLLWTVLGVLTGLSIWRAADTGDTISSSGRALSSVAGGLVDLSDLPLIPARPGEIGREVAVSADDITARGQEVKQQLHELAVLLGIVIVSFPLSPVVGFYLPMRVRRGRDLGRLRRLLRTRQDDPGLDSYLAGHARLTLSYEQISELVDLTKPELSDEDRRALADAELSRLGLTRPHPGGRRP